MPLNPNYSSLGDYGGSSSSPVSGATSASDFFDLFSEDGLGSLRSTYPGGDGSWRLRAIQSIASVQASALLDISINSNLGWNLVFKPAFQLGTGGNAWAIHRNARVDAVPAVKASLAWEYRPGRFINVVATVAGVAGNNFIINAFHAGTGLSSNLRSGSYAHDIRFTSAQTVANILLTANAAFNDVDLVAGTGYVATDTVTGNLERTDPGENAYLNLQNGAAGVAAEPVSVEINNADERIIFNILATDTLADIRAAASFANLTAIALVQKVGAFSEAATSFALLNTGIGFTGGIDASEDLIDKVNERVDVYYEAGDTLGDLDVALQALGLNTAYRGAYVATSVVEPPGFLRSFGAPTRTNFKDLTDTPSIIKPGRVVAGNAAGDALEFIRRAISHGGLEVVATVPADFQGAVLHLKHAHITQSGGISDRSLTPGFVAPDFYGYSDGTSYPATGILTGAAVPLAWVGSDSGTRDSNDVLTSWDVDYIASPVRSWLSGFKGGWIGGRGFALGSAEVFEGGVWLKGISGNISFPNATAKSFQLKNNDDSVYFLAETTVFLPGGILWWNGAKYVLLGEDTLLYKGLHVPALAYTKGDLVVIASGRAYVCIAAAVANTLITDTSKWVTLTRTSIVDLTGQGGHPQILAENKDQLHADFSIPRLWMPHHIPKADTPATGDSALWPITGKYIGTYDRFPSTASNGDIGYSRVSHVWERRQGPSVRATLTLVDITANKNDFPGAFVWLGERTDADDAAAHVPGNPTDLTAATSYLFYNKTTRVVEKLGSYVKATSPGTRYEATRLLAYDEYAESRSVQQTVGNPLVDENSQYTIEIDPSVPRAWLTQRKPFAGTPATGDSTPLKKASDNVFLGSFDQDPPSVIPGPEDHTFGDLPANAYVATEAAARALRTTYENNNSAWLAKYNANRFFYTTLFWSGGGVDGIKHERRNSAGDAWETFPEAYVLRIGQTYYNQFLHYWAIFSNLIVTTGQWTHTWYEAAFRTYSGTTYWLGERTDPNDAAAHVAENPVDSTGRYLFYNTTTHSVEQLTTDDIVLGQDAKLNFRPIPLVTFLDRELDVLVNTIENGPDVDVEMYTNQWTRNTTAFSFFGGNLNHPNQLNQIPFNRALTAVDDRSLMCIELQWEEVDIKDTKVYTNAGSTTTSSTVKTRRKFMATISTRAFRAMTERVYGGGTGENHNTYADSADWFWRRPDKSGGGFRQWAEMRVSYGRYRVAHKATHLAEDSANARANGPDGMALQFGTTVANPNATYMQRLRARIELHR